ncbi:putative phosphatidylglycerol/phosphatidylinositol transfer protein 2 [Actinia tenebrosa]|uniref:Phosphatidylglycerol/phosphatidylinositol transfer protein 2 n=1 Tax=Actinia tenebrosa TaxID=6105 RepID=A0A6P8HVT3_ACTTE|nr:putative phosphatidylglycerol/phosphatidylinositol transfer protein 2 [Actinia tenebrosa]
MLEGISSMFSYIRYRFFSIGYKKRIVIQILLLLFIAFVGVMLRPYFFANLAELDLFGESGTRGNFTVGWDKWTGQMEKLGYRSIGDVYDQCEPESPRVKIGKVLIHFDKKLGTVIATIATNFTMPVSLSKGTVHITAQYHGRTLFDQKYDLCKAKVDTFKCPMKKGQKMRIYETFKLPKYIPKGHYTSYAKGSNDDEICFIMAESNLNV